MDSLHKAHKKTIIIDHTHPQYIAKWRSMTGGRYNGAYYYSLEIVNNIIPNVRTSRNWVTLNIPGRAVNHAIVFIHNNMHPQNYGWLGNYKDLVLVCGVPETCDKVKHLGKAIYLPLSIDVAEVQKYKRAKDKEVCFAGRPAKRRAADLPPGIDILEGLPRDEMLAELARYNQVYAVGRTAIEARALGCEVLPYDPRYPDVSRWQVVDNLEAAALLQAQLDEIDNT